MHCLGVSVIRRDGSAASWQTAGDAWSKPACGRCSCVAVFAASARIHPAAFRGRCCHPPSTRSRRDVSLVSLGVCG
jgi:hypothetical protein